MAIRRNVQQKLLPNVKVRDKVTEEIFDRDRFVKTVVYIVFSLGIVAGFFLIRGAYEFVWSNTAGQPFTHIMRQFPLYYLIGLAALCGFLAALEFHANVRLIVMASMLGAGFVGGHVFWT